MNNRIEYLRTSEARAKLAARFGLPYVDDMQDWEWEWAWEVAAPERFDEFLRAYDAEDLSAAERFSLMEVLLQCVEESEPPALAEARWEEIEPHLAGNLELHRQTIEYWSCKGASEPDECFRITPRVRRVSALASGGE
ncbi:MAG TPA: hypothetical protein VIF10_12645 [Methylobacter sp.]|jgi:hypothetical protein